MQVPPASSNIEMVNDDFGLLLKKLLFLFDPFLLVCREHEVLVKDLLFLIEGRHHNTCEKIEHKEISQNNEYNEEEAPVHIVTFDWLEVNSD